MAQEKGVRLTEDLAFLPSLVKYGVSSKVACFLARWWIPREPATRIANHFSQKFSQDEDLLDDSSIIAAAEQAKRAICSLTENDIASLQLSETEIRQVGKIRSRFETER